MKRRSFAAASAATLIAGFDPTTRSWIGVAEARGRGHGLPSLDGQLVFDPAVLSDASTDAGNLFRRSPLAVLQPGSSADIAKMIRFCLTRDIPVAARGQAHTTFGQGLVENGLIIDMAFLNTIHSIGAGYADVDGGALWKDLVIQSVSGTGQAPPTLTGFLGLSIGGTLSVGGISSTPEAGPQVSHVRELEVVTGQGRIVTCSRSRHPALFESALAGLGQVGVITRAVVELAPVKPKVRTFLLNYYDNASFFADMRTLLERGEFDDIYNLWIPDGAGGWIYQLNAVKAFNEGEALDEAHLTRDLLFDPTMLMTVDQSFLDYALRVDAAIDFFTSIGLWKDVQHPWFDVFLPGSQVESYIGEVLPTLTPADVGPTGFMLLFPQRASNFDQPRLRVPQGEDWIYLFDILTAAPVPGPDPVFARQMLDRNRQLFEKARRIGGTRYPIGSLEFSRADWARHYGETFRDVTISKRRFDPRHVLTPGPGIF